MTTIDTVPFAPVTVTGVLDDPELAWRLCEANGPYAHVLMLRESRPRSTRTATRPGVAHPTRWVSSSTTSS